MKDTKFEYGEFSVFRENRFGLSVWKTTFPNGDVFETIRLDILLSKIDEFRKAEA